MPVYEYACKSCGKEFEYQQRMSDPEKTTCEACGAEALERLISRTAFSLKGGGWYKDLYSSSKPESKPAEGSSKPDGASGSSGDSASAPSTPAAAPAATPSPSTSSGGSSGSSGSGSSGSGSSGSSGSSSGSGGSTSKSAACGAK